MSLKLARTVADAVLFEGYLLYPYRSTSSKNRVRWQFGVLGPAGAAEASLGEESTMSAQCLLRDAAGTGRVTVHLRFLQLQRRCVEQATDDPDVFEPIEQLSIGARTWLSWDEAIEQEIELEPCSLSELTDQGRSLPVSVAGGADIEMLVEDDGATVGRIIRRRRPIEAAVSLAANPIDGLVQLSIQVDNVAPSVNDKDEAIQVSLIGAHLLVRAEDAQFVSLLEPPDDAVNAVAACTQRRCWPVMTGASGDTDIVLISPIILYDYPEVADESQGALFDSTEIDEILTLRVMTLTDEEKAQARATDPRAADIIDRCDSMSPEALAQLHGILRDPHAGVADEPFGDVGPVGSGDIRNVEPPTFGSEEVPWWDPEQDASVNPDIDSVLIDGVAVSRGSMVRVHPSRRADAQDLFFAGQTARVQAVHSDVDGEIHVAVVLVDDPAADMHEWYGRFLYFAPEELEPLAPSTVEDANPHQREESRSWRS
ncbi:MAG: hypothetical protein DLM58_21035 [Pseudonocardiales bacterium]|nr:MAG: hypothetical protein DLM58_21035 [Pseudonocardiales bacterium]